MAKFTYRAVEFNRFDWDKLAARAEGDLVVAIDVAKVDFFAALMKRDRTVLGTVKWRHPMDSRALIEAVMSRCAQGRVEVVMEPSGTYGDAVRQLWREAGAAVFQISPKRVHDAAELYDGVPSLHDAKAAYLIGRLHLENVSQPWVELSDERRESQATLRLLDFYQERRQRALNRLEALLARHWPEVEWFIALSAVSLLKLLMHYGSPAAVASDAEAAAAKLRRDGGHWLQAEKIAQVIESAQRTVGIPCVPAEQVLIQQLAKELLEVASECDSIEKTLKSTAAATPGLMNMASAVGAATATVVLSALGEPQGYPSAEGYAKAAGLNLKERSSGKHKGRLKLTKRGPSVVRKYIYFAALRLIHKDPDVQRWYQAKTARDGVKGKAITALMRKLMKALWHVGRGEAFDARKMFDHGANKCAA